VRDTLHIATTVAAPRDIPPVVSVYLDGPPVAKGMPRFRIVRPKFKPEFVHVYFEIATEYAMIRLREAGHDQMGKFDPLEGALRALVTAFIPIPESWSGAKRAAAAGGLIRPTSRPDWDNYAKITDALNKVVWKDDAQIVDGRVVKFYSDTPGYRVDVWQIETGLL
jgi:Holliday junction resolvase RusA-like endonuclease